MLMDSLRPLDEDSAEAAFAGAAPVPSSAPTADAVGNVRYPSGGRYGEDRRFSAGSWAAVIVLHAAVFAIALYAKPDLARAAMERLQVVEVRLDPPAPPPEPPRQDSPPPEVVPQMLRPPVQLTAEVAPAEIVDVLPPPRPPPPEVPAPAPQAPVVAPAPPSVVSGGDMGTRMVSGKPPRYPMESRRKREQGTVVLELTLGLDGAVSSISIARSSGFERLDDAARAAVRKWRWAPTLRDGVAVMVRGTVEIPFVLQA